ncbi:MAG: hypothetical protein HZB26_08540 [Candidatus Hydrogenedentes bacterium]|nr:hypothetical protein [Candidatus Hydrogenedentota bacterium]
MNRHVATFAIVIVLALVESTTAYAAKVSAKIAQRGLYNAVQMGAKGDGVADDTPAIQKALDAAAADGGGVVTLPTGKYLIKTHLTITENVALEGTWRAPSRGVPETGGTTLLAVEGKGNAGGAPFITMGTGSTLRGINVFYPEQIRANPPLAYPWTIQSANGADNCSILDVTLINSYQAVDFGTNVTGRHYIRGLYGYPFLKGLYINQCYDVGRIEDIHFWPFWDLDPNSPLWAFTKENGEAFIIGKSDGEMGSNLFSIFYKVGMHFIRGPVMTRKGPANQPGSGAYTNCYMDITPCAIKVDGVGADAGISFVNGMFMSTVEVGAENSGQVKFTGCGFWSNKNITTTQGKLQGSGTVFFESCHFTNWDQKMDGTACIDADCKSLIVTGCEFQTKRTGHNKVRLGPNVESAIISSNRMESGVLILKNDVKDGADIQIGLNTAK